MINHLFVNVRNGKRCDICFGSKEEHMTKLCDLARKHSTDKGGDHGTYNHQPSEHSHNYTPVYASLFEGEENYVRGVLEIGVNQGCSLRMWKEYFPNASIVGIDIEENYLFAEPRITCLKADQSDPKSLCNSLSMLHPDGPLFDLIIDDGSHDPSHQITSMKTLLAFLSKYGYYVIEDIHCDPMDIGKHVPLGYLWSVPPTPGGKGCGANEKLMVIHRDNSN